MVHSSAKLIALIEEAGLQDTTVRRLLQPSGVSLEELRDVDKRFTLTQILGIFQFFVQHIEDPVKIFAAGQRFRFTDFGAFGLAAMSQPNLKSALSFAMKYRELSSPIIGLDVRSSADHHKLVFYPHAAASQFLGIYSRILDFNIGMFISLAADATGADQFVSKLYLSNLADRETREMMLHSGYQVEKHAPEDAIEFESSALDMPLRQSSTVGATMGQRLCASILANSTGFPKFASEVRAVIIANIDKPLTTDFVAMHLGVSERGLRRRLSQEGLSFREIKLNVQDDMACRYLVQTRMKVEDVASAVGYSNAANFRRAFRRVHGIPPANYRQNLHI